MDRMEWRKGVALRGGFGFGLLRSGGGSLSCREGIIFVITGDMQDGGISSGCVEKVGESDAVAIPIPPDTDDGEFRIRELYSCGERDSPSVQGFCSVALYVLVHFGVTADSGDDDGFMFGNIELLESLFEGCVDHEVSASGASLEFGDRSHREISR